MRTLTRRAFVRNALLSLLTISSVRKFLLATGIMETVCNESFQAEQETTVKAFLESTGLRISGRSQHPNELLDGHFLIDAINGEEQWFLFTVDDYLFREECTDHYPIYPQQRLTVYCL